ncbi:uncharacterized protein LOC116101222 [Mastomys coucha]|uniref:uncharacterized protein LOC116101222 n=1 Tax=Mastomys coucha TaxID=35658 RepID=UPI001261BCFD|nr:uncharacterized protein LOC116101222 [Mastomys coucha]
MSTGFPQFPLFVLIIWPVLKTKQVGVEDPWCWSNGAGIPLKSRTSNLLQEGLSAPPDIVSTNPSRASQRLSFQWEPAETLSSSYPFPFGPGPEPAPQAPLCSQLFYHIQRQNLTSLTSVWLKDPRACSSTECSGICGVQELESNWNPTPASPQGPQTVLLHRRVGSCGFLQPISRPAVTWSMNKLPWHPPYPMAQALGQMWGPSIFNLLPSPFSSAIGLWQSLLRRCHLGS